MPKRSRNTPISKNKSAQLSAKPRSAKALKAYAAWVLETLRATYPDAHCELDYANAFELLVATILSAQCTDVRVNLVTPALFKAFPDPAAFAAADLSHIEALIRPTGFFHNKAVAIQSSSRQLMAQHGGEVPNDMNALTALKGVGRKTASVVMGNAFGEADGIVVDTHVSRLSQRLGLTREQAPEKIEQALMQLIPQADWVMFPHLMIAHGRQLCKARKPLCSVCPLAARCPSAEAG